jgi:hypothetical protein
MHLQVKQELLKTLQGDDEPSEEDGGVNEAFTGAPQAGPNKWASCIRLVDPVQGETLSLLELDDNEAAFSMCTMRFGSKVCCVNALFMVNALSGCP